MNRSFDSTGIAFDVDLWKDILRVLKPGGHVAAFAASRTYHRLACAIEDAGFEIRDQIDWVYASGMPHGSDATLMIDRERREDVEPTRSETAKPFKGWYSQLKPAHEPICLARKPLDGNLAHNLLGHGTGALHIDACRVPFRNTADEAESKGKNQHGRFGSGPRDNHVYGADKANRTDYTAAARFTPNMLFDQSTAKELDRQSGVTVSRKGKPRASTKPGDGWGMTHTGAEYDDMGGASRFYPVFRYCPKASSAERPKVDGIPPSDSQTGRTHALACPSRHPGGWSRAGAVRRQRHHIGSMPTRTHAMHGKRTRSRLHQADPRTTQQTNTKRTFLERSQLPHP